MVSNIYNYDWRCSNESSCVDADGDGHYAINANCPTGDDPNDSDPAVYPGAPDLCGDFKDNNGSGNIDLGCGNSCPRNKPTLNVPIGSSTNVMSGNLFHSQTLFATSGGQLPISIDLNYASLNVYKGALGTGWHHSYELFLVVQAGKVFFRSGDGSITAYTLNATGTYDSPAGDYSTLTKNGDGTFTISYRDGLKRNFGTDGKITSIVDRYGNSLAFTYTTGDLTAITDSSQRQVILNYDLTVTPHRITDIFDPGTNKYHFDYDPTTGLLSKVTNPAADTQPGTVQGYWAYTYENGRLKTKTDPNNKVTTYFYQADGRMTGSLDPEGSIDLGVVAGHARTLQYDVSGKTTFTEKDGGQWQYIYNPQTGALNQKIDPNRKITSYYYYADAGFLKAKTEPFYFDTTANKQFYLTTFYQHDGFGNIVNETDPVNLSTYNLSDAGSIDIAKIGTTGYPAWTFSYTYDNYDRLLTRTDLRGATPLVTSYTYDTTTEPGVEIMKVTDPENKLLTYRYNSAGGTLKSVTDANNVSGTYDYYPNGLLLSVKDQNGVVTKITLYDGNGNPKQLQKLDKAGKLLVTTTLDFDALNRLRKVVKTTTDTPPIVAETKYDFDQVGTLTVTDPELKQTKYEYNYNGQITKITDPDLKETRLTYGGTGCSSCGGGVDKLTEVKDAKQLANNWDGTTYFYDKLGRLEHETDPRRKTIRYTYYDNGLVKEKIDASATPKTLISYEYNNRGQLTKKRQADGFAESYEYDANGRLWKASNPNISYTLDWYKNGLLKSITDNTGKALQYEYDGGGNRTKMIAPDGMPFWTWYDEANRPYWYYTPVGTITLSYDDSGRPWQLVNGNGVTTTYTYDGLDRLIRILATTYSGQPISDVGYGYYRAGNRQTRTEPDKTITYGYDNLYRLTSAVTTGTTSASETYTYDEVGNRRSGPTADISYDYSLANQLDGKTGIVYTYDDYGNLRTATQGADVTTYTHDSENRLTKVERKVGTTTNTTTYKYDPFGRRIEKSTQRKVGYATDPAHVQSFVYDGANVLDVSEIYQYTTRYINGFFGLDDVLAATTNPGGSYSSTSYNVKDALGSVTKTTGTSGTLTKSITYDSFGVLSDPTISGYTYTGREWDAEAGLYYYRARYYDPTVGRFIERDPISFAGGDVNLYGYVQNNPINWIDPLGLAVGTISYGGNPIPYSIGLNGRELAQLSNSQFNGYLQALKDYLQMLKKALSIGSGAGVACATKRVDAGIATYEAFEAMFSLIEGEPFDLPFVKIPQGEPINPRPAY